MPKPAPRPQYSRGVIIAGAFCYRGALPGDGHPWLACQWQINGEGQAQRVAVYGVIASVIAGERGFFVDDKSKYRLHDDTAGHLRGIITGGIGCGVGNGVGADSGGVYCTAIRGDHHAGIHCIGDGGTGVGVISADHDCVALCGVVDQGDDRAQPHQFE